jgi:hypothetical protein
MDDGRRQPRARLGKQQFETKCSYRLQNSTGDRRLRGIGCGWRVPSPPFVWSAPAQGTRGGGAELTGRITPELSAMQRLLPQYLIFLAAHALLIGTAVAVAAFN